MPDRPKAQALTIATLTVISAVLSAALAASQEPTKTPAPDAFVGTFRSQHAELRVHAGGKSRGDTHHGSVHLREQAFPFTATRHKDAIRGSFRSGKTGFSFEAELDGSDGKRDVLVFRTGRTVLRLTRAAAAPTNPFDRLREETGHSAKTSKTRQAAVQPAAKSKSRILTHPGGFEIRAPRAWRHKAHRAARGGAAVMTVMPPDVDPAMPSAMILVTSLPRRGPLAKLRSADDPQLERLGLFPKLEAKSRRSIAHPLGQASLREYEGSTNPGMQPLRARLHVWILPESIVTCLAVTKASEFSKRDQDFASIVASLRRAQPASAKRTAAGAAASALPDDVRKATRDLRLVGRWRNTMSRVVRGRPGESTSIASDLFCTLRADGRYSFGSGEFGFSSRNRIGSTTGLGKRKDDEIGFWKTVGNVVYHRKPEDKSWTRFGRYAISGNSLLIYYPNGNKVLWER